MTKRAALLLLVGVTGIAVWTACTGDDPVADNQPRGGLGQPCLATGGCNVAELQCVGNQCVTSAATSSTSSGSGSSAGSSGTSGSNDAAVAVESGTAAQCVAVVSTADGIPCVKSNGAPATCAHQKGCCQGEGCVEGNVAECSLERLPWTCMSAGACNGTGNPCTVTNARVDIASANTCAATYRVVLNAETELHKSYAKCATFSDPWVQFCDVEADCAELTERSCVPAVMTVENQPFKVNVCYNEN